MLIILIIAIPLFTTPAFGQDADSSRTVAETIASNDSLSTFAAELEAAGLMGILRQEGPFTVFAPTNEAFEVYEDEHASALVQQVDPTQIFAYHVMEGDAIASDVGASSEITTLQGSTLSIDIDGATVHLNGQAQIVQADIGASNGTIHIVNSVLSPLNIEKFKLNRQLPSAAQIFTNQLTFLLNIDAPLSLSSIQILAQVSEANIDSWAYEIVGSVPIFAQAEEQYRSVPLEDRMSAEDRSSFAQQMISGEGFQDVGWGGIPLTPEDYVVRSDLSIGASEGEEQTELSYLVVADDSGVKFDPLRWLTPTSAISEADLEKNIFWSGSAKNLYGYSVVSWEFSVEFVPVDGCDIRAISVEKMVRAPGPGWHAEGDTGHNIFPMERFGCDYNDDDISSLQDHMTCVQAEAALGYGSGSPEIGISSSGVGVTVGGLAFVSYDETNTYRVCADGQEP